MFRGKSTILATVACIVFACGGTATASANTFSGLTSSAIVETGRSTTLVIPKTGTKPSITVTPTGSVGEIDKVKVNTEAAFTESAEEPYYASTGKGIQSETTGWGPTGEHIIGPIGGGASCSPPSSVTLAELGIASTRSGTHTYSIEFQASCVLGAGSLNDPGTAEVVMEATGPTDVRSGEEVTFTNVTFSVRLPEKWVEYMLALGGTGSEVRSTSASTFTVSQEVTKAPLIVPAYFVSVGGSDTEWEGMVNKLPAHSIAIVNPLNGPWKERTEPFTAAITYAHAADKGVEVLGYVPTDWDEATEEIQVEAFPSGAPRTCTHYPSDCEKATKPNVEKWIEHWYSDYPSIDGIFFDQYAAEPVTGKTTQRGNEEFYEALRKKVREGRPSSLIVGNPGTASEASGWPLAPELSPTTPDVNTLVAFENDPTGYTAYSPPTWVKDAPANEIASIEYGEEDGPGKHPSCPTKGYAGYEFATDEYGVLPAEPFWSEVAADC